MRLILTLALALVSSAACAETIVKQVTVPVPDLVPYPREPCLKLALKAKRQTWIVTDATVVSRNARTMTVACRFDVY